MEPSEELVQAASEGNVPRLRELITAGCPVDARPRDQGPTPLVAALAGRRMEAVHYLVRAGADVGVSRCDGKPLHSYAYTVVRDKDLFRTFLGAGARPNEVDDEGFPCLYHTLEANDYDSSALLVSRGADVNATAAGQTLLSHFVRQPAAVDFLLGKGADPNVKTPDHGLTPLMVLVGSGSDADPDIVEALLRAKADIGATTRKEGKEVDALDLAKQTLSDALRAAKETTNSARMLEAFDEQARASIGEVEAGVANLRKVVRLLKQNHPQFWRRLFG
jgi:ankyrin repeat protein